MAFAPDFCIIMHPRSLRADIMWSGPIELQAARVRPAAARVIIVQAERDMGLPFQAAETWYIRLAAISLIGIKPAGITSPREAVARAKILQGVDRGARAAPISARGF